MSAPALDELRSRRGEAHREKVSWKSDLQFVRETIGETGGVRSKGQKDREKERVRE